MIKKVIKYSEKKYCIFLNIIYILFLSTLLILTIKQEYYELAIFCSIFILSLIFLSYIFMNYNIVFDYNKQIIKALEPGHFKCVSINMGEIKIIKFYEVKSEKKFSVTLFERRLYNFDPIYVYNYGKKYYIEIIKTNGKIIKIPYNSLYRCKNIKELEIIEKKIKTIIKEFNDFKYNKYFKNSFNNDKK